MNKSESIKELATALCKFQGAVETVRKEATNPFFKSKYASLANILDVIRKPLFENGLSFVQLPAGEHQLTTMLMHTSGEWIEETYSMTPAKNDPQGLGSVITYQRRYALGAVLGLNIDEDDDGNAGSKTEAPKKEPVKENRDYSQQIKMLKECKSLSDLATVYNSFTLDQKAATKDAKDDMKIFLTT